VTPSIAAIGWRSTATILGTFSSLQAAELHQLMKILNAVDPTSIGSHCLDAQGISLLLAAE